MDRRSDIFELLESVGNDLLEIHGAYEAARKDEGKESVVRPKIKSCFENLRSCLEYTAQDVWASYTKKKNSVYFPYGKSEEFFISSVKRNLPGLKDQSPIAYKIIESIQPHVCGDTWLPDLCQHTNFNKHDRLSKQVRKNSPSSVTTFGNIIKLSGSGGVKFINCFANGLPMSKAGELVISSQRKVSEMNADLFAPILISREFDWVEFEILGTTSDILKLLKKSHLNISNFVAEILPIISQK